jgi:quinol monooxygenase YgiN
MHLEVVILAARDGNSAALIDAMRDGGGAAALESAPGCHSVEVMPGVEKPENVLFLVKWESVDAHNAARDSDGFRKFTEIAGPYFGGLGGGEMQHFDAG